VSVSACTTLPSPAAFDLRPGARVGIVSQLDEAIGHKHFVGLKVTIDIVFEKEKWGLNDFLHSEFSRVLKENNYEYVHITPEQLTSAGARTQYLFEIVDNRWALLPDANQSIDYLKGELALDAVLSFSPNTYKVIINCTSWGCTEHNLTQPGYYSTTSFISFSQVEASYAVIPFRKNVVILNPPTTIAEEDYVGSSSSLLKALSGKVDPHRQSISKFKPKDVKALTQDELARIRSELKLLITATVIREVAKLVAGSEGPAR
jgi:hypothetical protein